jgi:hypothetical protein
MQSTSRSRRVFKGLLFAMTSVAICQFPVADCALQWYNAFHLDHDADFLLHGVSEEFSYDFTDPDPGGAF